MPAKRRTSAADRWQESLARWAIPRYILDAAPESPWGFSPELFVRRAEMTSATESFSTRKALEALPEKGAVLDVGCGGGAASLPLTIRAGRLIGVDSSAEMLSAFAASAASLGVDVQTIEGSWPDVAPATPVADVVVCHHVVYNVPNLAAFASSLTEHARSRVVVELTARHPMSRLNDLWLRFHGLHRPEEPDAGDAVQVLSELGVAAVRHDWEEPSGNWLAPFQTREEFVSWLRRRLCLPADRDQDIWEAVAPLAVERGGGFSLPPLPAVTLWWGGSAV